MYVFVERRVFVYTKRLRGERQSVSFACRVYLHGRMMLAYIPYMDVIVTCYVYVVTDVAVRRVQRTELHRSSVQFQFAFHLQLYIIESRRYGGCGLKLQGYYVGSGRVGGERLFYCCQFACRIIPVVAASECRYIVGIAGGKVGSVVFYRQFCGGGEFCDEIDLHCYVARYSGYVERKVARGGIDEVFAVQIAPHVPYIVEFVFV